jgi:hypothetical protein
MSTRFLVTAKADMALGRILMTLETAKRIDRGPLG